MSILIRCNILLKSFIHTLLSNKNVCGLSSYWQMLSFISPSLLQIATNCSFTEYCYNINHYNVIASLSCIFLWQTLYKWTLFPLSRDNIHYANRQQLKTTTTYISFSYHTGCTLKRKATFVTTFFTGHRFASHCPHFDE